MAFYFKKIRIFLVSILFLIPLNLYKIGKDLGAGVQWALFRFQITDFGTMWFTIIKEIDYVLSGTITGKSAASLILWSLGALSLVAILSILLVNVNIQRKNFYLGISLIGSGLLFLASCIFQYGITLKGSAGYCFPIGIPVILVIGVLIDLGYFDDITEKN